MSKRILIAEDDPNDVELIVNALDEHGLAGQVGVVRDGVEALDYLYRRGVYSAEPEGNPVVILLDLKMPRLDGLEVLRQLKGDDRLRTIPVVIITSSREQSDLKACYELGANAYVVKPVQFAEFAGAVSQVGAFWGLINEPPPAVAHRQLVSDG